MFKKPIKVGAQNQLSGKDRKAIKNKLAAQFDPECTEKIFTKNDKIICNKITGSKMLIYISEDEPLFVDGTGKEDYFPSIYLCAAYEGLVKTAVINQGVQEYIFNGANLMWPGVKDIRSLGKFKKDQTVGIRTTKGEIIAIGAMGCSIDELKTNTDGSGIAVYILHFRGDKLWDLGPKVYPEVIVKAKVQVIEEPKVQAPQKKEEVKVQAPPKKEEAAKIEEEEVPEQKGKGKKGKKGGKEKVESEEEEKKEQKKKVQQKPQPKKQAEPVKKQESQSEEEQLDFGAFVKSKNQPQKSQTVAQTKNEKKKPDFSDEEDDRKGKKKAAKKAGKKKQESEQQQQPPKKQQKNTKAKFKEEDEDDQPVKKGKKGKGKKPQSQDEQEEPVQKKDNKKKQTKKEKKKVESESQKEEHSDEEKQQKKQQQPQKQQKSAISTQVMDQHFKQAFLNVLKLSKIEGQLPIDSGRFFSDYMVLARSQGVKLEIKDTSFKKLGKFYEQMAKLKIIEFKPAKEKKGQQGSTITKIFWENQELKSYFPTIKRMGEKDVEEKVEEYSKEKLKLSKTIQVDYVYKLNEDLKKILLKKVINYMPDHSSDQEKPEDLSKEIFLTEKELKEKIEKYINQIAVKQKAEKPEKAEKPQKPEKGQKGWQKGEKGEKGDKGDKAEKSDKQVTLNYKDNDFIFKILKSEIEQYEENLAKEEEMMQEEQLQKKNKKKKNLFRLDRGYLVNKIMKLASSHYNLVDKENGVNKFKQGAFKGIQLIADKVVNKNVTKVLGLQSFIPANVKEEQVVKQIHGFAHQLQLKFASSSTVQNLAGKNAGKEIIIQGNFVEELESMLMQEYGIKKEYITIQNKLGKKKKN